MPAPPLFTIGHSTRAIDEFVAILRAADVTRVVDVRSIPRSRTNPQFDEDALRGALEDTGIAYEQAPALGGRRSKSRVVDERVNAGWTHRAFHNYADHALSEEFRVALDALLATAKREPTAILCSEAVWWRCHRRIVTDHVLARGVPVVHLMGEDKRTAASLTPFAHVEGARVTYPADVKQR